MMTMSKLYTISKQGKKFSEIHFRLTADSGFPDVRFKLLDLKFEGETKNLAVQWKFLHVNKVFIEDPVKNQNLDRVIQLVIRDFLSTCADGKADTSK